MTGHMVTDNSTLHRCDWQQRAAILGFVREQSLPGKDCIESLTDLGVVVEAQDCISLGQHFG